MKVMIVDDHAAIRRVISHIVMLALGKLAEVIECESAEQAVLTYCFTYPDYVLMDLEMHDMNGFEATKSIRKIDSKAKVIIVSSHDSPSFRVRAKKLGVISYILKEDLSELDGLLKNGLNVS